MIFRKASSPSEDNFDHRWIGDVKRIQQVAQQNGYEADLEACAYLWDYYSDSMCAGWMGLPEDDNELWDMVYYEAKYLSDLGKGFEVYE